MHSYFLVRVLEVSITYTHSFWGCTGSGPVLLQEVKLEHGAAPWVDEGVSFIPCLPLLLSAPWVDGWRQWARVWSHCWYRREYFGRGCCSQEGIWGEWQWREARERGVMQEDVHKSVEVSRRQSWEILQAARQRWLRQPWQYSYQGFMFSAKGGRGWEGKSWDEARGWAGNHHCSWERGARGMGTGGGRGAPGLSILVGTEVILGAPVIRPHERLLSLVFPLFATSWSCRPGSRTSCKIKRETSYRKLTQNRKTPLTGSGKHITRNKHWSIITMSTAGMTESRPRKMDEILDTSCCYKVNPISASLSHFLTSKPPTLHATSSRTHVWFLNLITLLINGIYIYI